MNELERMKKLSDDQRVQDLEYWRQRAYEAYDFLAEKEKGIAFWKKIAKGWEQSRDKWFEKAKDGRAALKRQQTSRVARVKEMKALQKEVEGAERSAKNWEKEAQRYAANSDHWQERLAESKRIAEWLKDTWSEFDEPMNPECELAEPFETIYAIAADWHWRMKRLINVLEETAGLSAVLSAVEYHGSMGAAIGACTQCADIITKARKVLNEIKEESKSNRTSPEGATMKTDKTEAPTYFTDREREAFEDPDLTEPAWKAIQHFIDGYSGKPLFYDFAIAITWLKKRADDEKERLSKLEKIVDAMWLHHGNDMK